MPKFLFAEILSDKVPILLMGVFLMGEISSVTWLYLVLIQFVQILFNLNLNKLNQNQVQDEISPVRKSNFGGRDYDVWKEMTF